MDNNDLINDVANALNLEQPTEQPVNATEENPAQATPPANNAGTQQPQQGATNQGQSTEQPAQSTQSGIDGNASGDNPIKLLRNQYEETKRKSDQQEALLRRIAESQNVTVEELENKIREAEDKQNAQSKNIPIEVQRQLREQEEQIRQLQIQNVKADYISRSEKLRSEYKLTDQQIIDFSEQAKKLGFNPFTPGLDLGMLYRAINYDSIVGDLKNQIRQEVLAELQRGGNSNNVMQTTTTPPAANTSPTETPSNNELMAELFNSFKK